MNHRETWVVWSITEHKFLTTSHDLTNYLDEAEWFSSKPTSDILSDHDRRRFDGSAIMFTPIRIEYSAGLNGFLTPSTPDGLPTGTVPADFVLCLTPDCGPSPHFACTRFNCEFSVSLQGRNFTYMTEMAALADDHIRKCHPETPAIPAVPETAGPPQEG